jgi:hypothetical protein
MDEGRAAGPILLSATSSICNHHMNRAMLLCCDT